MPKLLGERAASLARVGLEEITIEKGALLWEGDVLARVDTNAPLLPPKLIAGKALENVPATARQELLEAIESWLAEKLAPLEPLAKIEAATRDPASGSEARALLLKLVAGAGYVARRSAGLEHLPKELRPFLRKLGVQFGALDVYAPALLKPVARQMLHALGCDRRRLESTMQPVLEGKGKLPAGYRPAGDQAVRIDIADKLIRAAHESRVAQSTPERRKFRLDNALAISTGLTPRSFERLLDAAGFRVQHAPALAEGAFGPPAPDRWGWRPQRNQYVRKSSKRSRGKPKASDRPGNPFAELAGLVK